LKDTILEDLAEFTGPDWEQEDDITMVTLQRSEGYGVSEVASRSIQKTDEEDVKNGTGWQLLTEFKVPSAPGN